MHANFATVAISAAQTSGPHELLAPTMIPRNTSSATSQPAAIHIHVLALLAAGSLAASRWTRTT